VITHTAVKKLLFYLLYIFINAFFLLRPLIFHLFIHRSSSIECPLLHFVPGRRRRGRHRAVGTERNRLPSGRGRGKEAEGGELSAGGGRGMKGGVRGVYVCSRGKCLFVNGEETWGGGKEGMEGGKKKGDSQISLAFLVCLFFLLCFTRRKTTTTTRTIRQAFAQHSTARTKRTPQSKTHRHAHAENRCEIQRGPWLSLVCVCHATTATDTYKLLTTPGTIPYHSVLLPIRRHRHNPHRQSQSDAASFSSFSPSLAASSPPPRPPSTLLL